MQVEWEDRYDAPAEVVLRMFADPAFHERKLAEMGLARFEVLDHEHDDHGFAIRVLRHVPANLPGIKAGATQVTHSERWQLPEGTGEIRAEPKGMPLDMRCSATVEDRDSGCVARYRWEVKASLPVVGRSLEKFVAADMKKRAAEEAEIARRFLDDYR